MIVVLHNTDGEGGAVDAASVAGAARAVADALVARGERVELVGVRGVDALAALVALAQRPPELIVNLCESLAGRASNEPTLAGVLDLLGLRYTGADLVALASCLHKDRAKRLLLGAGVPTPPYRVLACDADLADPTLDALDYPWFVKPVREDASVGITDANVARSAAALRARAGELMRELAQPVLAERYVAGREVNVGFVGDRMLPMREIDFAGMPADRPNIVSYAAKWDEAHVDYAGTTSVPLAAASPALVAELERVARAAWRVLGLRDYGRVDLRVDAAGQPWVIDVNPNCDVSPDAGLAKAAAAAGLAYEDLVAAIVASARARAA
nr:hypothetical protein [Kofleriaceae bacterium]